MAKSDGRRDLSLIRASGSTARILNLALIAETHGEEEEYKAKPLFRGKKLNATLILKHTLRAHERDLFSAPKTNATKIIFPFARGELGLGGVSIMVGERNYERMIRQSAGGYADEAAFTADLELLSLLDSVPSFDPFLLRERLRSRGIEPARCYFDIAEADLARMRAFVSSEIAKLIELAFASGVGGAELSQRMAEKLMTDETAKSLDPLRETLRLSGEEYVEGVFAWKGFLYYKWLMSEFRPLLVSLKPRFAGLRILRSTAEERRELAETRKEILSQMDRAIANVDRSLLEYGEAFSALAEGHPNAFRSFLLKAPSMFIPIGEAIGIVKHIHSFWRFRFPGEATPVMEADEAMEVLHEFGATLTGVAFARSEANLLVA